MIIGEGGMLIVSNDPSLDDLSEDDLEQALAFPTRLP